MKLAILGGTFNPPHHGHLSIARSVLDGMGFELVVFVPTNIPVHKNGDPTVTSDDRLRMVDLATGDHRGLAVDRCDVDRGGVSYSIDTVTDILRTYDVTGKPGFVVGDDLIDGFSTWKRVEELVSAVDLLVAHRHSAVEIPFCYPHRYIANPVVRCSSSDIRDLVRRGLPIGEFVPAPVAEYITMKRLYRTALSDENGAELNEARER